MQVHGVCTWGRGLYLGSVPGVCSRPSHILCCSRVTIAVWSSFFSFLLKLSEFFFYFFRCKCLTKTCHYNKDFDRENCECRCKPDFSVLKRECATTGRSTRNWDEDTCTCRCRPRVCVEGHYQDVHTCDCKPVESTCTAVGVRDDLSSHSTPHQLTSGVSKYIGLTCMVLLTLIMLITLYILIQRRRHMDSNLNHGLSNLSNRTLPHGLDAGSIASLTGTLRGHQHATSSGTTAYTITINSQAANMDESILPLTEDKTRF